MKVLTEMDVNVLVIASKAEWDAYKGLMIAIDHMLNFPAIDSAPVSTTAMEPQKATRDVAHKAKPSASVDKREKKRLANIAYRAKRKAREESAQKPAVVVGKPAAGAKRCGICGEKFASPGAYCSLCLANRKVDVLVHMADNRKAAKS